MEVSLAHELRALLVEILPRISEVLAWQGEPFSERSAEPTIPPYLAFRLDADPAIMGVDYPQINGVEGHKANLFNEADSIDMDDLLMKVGAAPTDFVSCDFLNSRGLFVSPNCAERLRAYSIAEATWQTVTVNRRYPDARRDLEYAQLDAADIVDWANSTFTHRRRNEDDQEISFADLDACQQQVWTVLEQGDGSSIVPRLIRLTSYKDLFRFPLGGQLIASRHIARLLAAQNLTGATLHPLRFEIS